VTGAFSATASFPLQAAPKVDGDGRAARPVSARKAVTSGGGTDVFLAKYDRSGKLIWLTQAGGPGDDNGFDLGFDAAGNIYVAGAFTDSATFRGTNDADTTVSGLGETIFLAKYTPSGVLAWVQTGTAAFNSLNEGFGVAVEPDTGSIYVTGRSQGDTAFSSSNGTTHSVAGPSTWHMYLVKYDAAGNFQWGQSNQAEVNSLAHKVAVDAGNNVYATGWMEGQTTFRSNDGQDLTADGFSGPIQSPDFPEDAFVVKYDGNGNAKWVNHIGGYKAIGIDIATSRDGKVSITGFIGNIASSMPEQGATIVTSQPGGKDIDLGGGIFTQPYNKDAFVATYDAAGVLLDARRFGGAMDDGGSGIAYDRRSNLIVAGVFQGTIKIEGRILTGKDPLNLFVAKFGPTEKGQGAGDGTESVEEHAFAAKGLHWIKEADGPGAEGFENNPRIALTRRGNVLVTGAYQPAAQFDSFILNSVGLDDVFLALLSG
jgi:hypothetical protein